MPWPEHNGPYRRIGRPSGLLSQAQTYLLGRDTLGWTGGHYQEWLETTITRLIAAAGAGR